MEPSPGYLLDQTPLLSQGETEDNSSVEKSARNEMEKSWGT